MSFPPELKIPKQEVKNHEYHSLKTKVLKENLFSEEKEMPIQLCIDDYSQHMGGVDVADQLSTYLISHVVAKALLGIRCDGRQCLFHLPGPPT